ncbi:hypothetical protein FAGAP_2222 [Fusarium agapanthi]|uniref:Clr5 domain-containing protein n=1 Tax=Fusarium agapanthi TaxID=1803897 RepID=A0A9P5BJM2_9HYPO|nr:hypothetical protein FAGAP_2222 [Fusarium agapanthi]
MRQASRISPALWEAQRPRITELYVNQDKTLDEVIQIMAESEKWQHASALVTKREADGKITQLSIDGKVVSEKRRKKELRRYHVSQIEEEFAATNTSGVVACTPPSSDSRVVLINGLPWLKFRESFNNLIKSQPPPFGPNQQNASLGFWGVPNPLISGVRNTREMATGSLPPSLPLPPRPVSDDLSKHVDIKGQRLFEVVPMLDNSMEILRHQEPPWLQTFNSLVFLCSNNLMGTESSAYELLYIAISSGFLIKVKHLFTMRSPTLEIFARHLLFVTLRVEGSKGMEFLRFLLKSGVSADSTDSTDPNGYRSSALRKAVRQNHRDAVQHLLQFGADPNGKKSQDLELAILLLAEGADVNSSAMGKTPLQEAAREESFEMYAAMNGSVGIVKYLVQHGASVNEKASPFHRATALGLAIDKGHSEAAIYLIGKGASIDKRLTADGETPLQLAAKHGDYEIVTYLVEKGAAVNAAPATERGATALQFAAINGNIKMAIFLLENGAHVSAKGAEDDGRTALEGAVEHGLLDMIYLLLDNDEEPDTIEERCCHAAEFAEAEQHDVIARVLRNYKRP